MQILCYHCHKPYALNRDAVHTGLDQIESEKLSHYDVPCPHCRRVNRVTKKELLRAAPDWKQKSAERTNE